MSKISLAPNASGTGIFTIASPNSNTNRTLTLPDNAGTIITSGTAGTVLQVVSTTKTDTFTTTSSSFVDLTGVSVSITPTSASSKIMIIATLMAGADVASTTFMSRLVRDSTSIALGDSAGSRDRVTFGTDDMITANTNLSIALTFLDSPSTTSATTYKVQVAQTRTAGGTLTVNRDGNDSDSAQVPRGSSTITVMEIAG
jgi:hypothetical protein